MVELKMRWLVDAMAILNVVGCAKYPTSFKEILMEMPTTLILFVKTDPVKVGLFSVARVASLLTNEVPLVPYNTSKAVTLPNNVLISPLNLSTKDVPP